MLVLARKLGERIMIGDGVAVTVVEMDRRNVRLAIEAPRSVTVLREELVLENPSRKRRKSADRSLALPA